MAFKMRQKRTFLQQYLAYLLQLPPRFNKFEEGADGLAATPRMLPIPDWAYPVLAGIAVLYGIQLVTACSASALLLRTTGERPRLMQRGRYGIWMPHTTLCYCGLTAVFCILNMVNMIWLILIHLGQASDQGFYAFPAAVWLPMYTAEYVFLHSLLAQVIILRNRRNPPRSGLFARLREPDFSSKALNASLVAVPIVFTSTLISVAVLQQNAISATYTLLDATARNLRALVPTYNATTFAPNILAQALSPLQTFEAVEKRSVVLNAATAAVFAGFSLLLALVFTPLLVIHLKLLGRLNGAANFFQSLPLLCCGSRDDPTPPARRVEVSFTTPSEKALQSRPQMARRLAQRSVRRRYRASSRPSAGSNASSSVTSLMWSAIFIYSVVLVLGAWSLWIIKCISEKASPENGAAAVLPNGIFALLGLFINTGFLVRTLRARRRVRATQIQIGSDSNEQTTQGSVHVVVETTRFSIVDPQSRPDRQKPLPPCPDTIHIREPLPYLHGTGNGAERTTVV